MISQATWRALSAETLRNSWKRCHRHHSFLLLVVAVGAIVVVVADAHHTLFNDELYKNLGKENQRRKHGF